jgi:hypothetical protein
MLTKGLYLTLPSLQPTEHIAAPAKKATTTKKVVAVKKKP